MFVLLNFSTVGSSRSLSHERFNLRRWYDKYLLLIANCAGLKEFSGSNTISNVITVAQVIKPKQKYRFRQFRTCCFNYFQLRDRSSFVISNNQNDGLTQKISVDFHSCRAKSTKFISHNFMKNVLPPLTLWTSSIKCLNLCSPSCASSLTNGTNRQWFVTQSFDSGKKIVSCLLRSSRFFSICSSISLSEYIWELLDCLGYDFIVRLILFHSWNHRLYYGLSFRFCWNKLYSSSWYHHWLVNVANS